VRFHIKYADRVVGAFIVLAALLLCASVFVIGANQRWFARDYRFSTRFDSASGLSVGMPLQMKGFQVGKVTKLSLNEENLVDVDFVIYDTYYAKAREGSIVELVTSPIGLGTQFLFHAGRGSGQVAEGSFMPTANSEEGMRFIEEGLVDMPVKDDTITKLLASIGPLMDNANKAIVTLNRTLADADQAIVGKGSGPLADILRKGSNLVSNADGVISNVGGKADDVLVRARDIEASLAKVTDNLVALSDALRDPTGLVPRLLDAKGSIKTVLDDQNALYNGVMATIASAQASIRNIQSMTASLNAEMPTVAATLAETQATIRKAQDVLESLRNNPLLKGGVPKAVDQGELYQGMRDAEF
jgi:phospholipid/cholesterol/gamma-HCH transport system substrate-binding protein